MGASKLAVGSVLFMSLVAGANAKAQDVIFYGTYYVDAAPQATLWNSWTAWITQPLCRPQVPRPVRGANESAVSADYDGDRRFDVSVKQDDGEWSIDFAANGFGAWDVTYAGFGGSDHRPVPGDYDGDCKADLSTLSDLGVWFIDYASNGFGEWDTMVGGYGTRQTVPVPADYDGDGAVDLATKNINGTWSIDYARNGFGSWDAAYPGFGGAEYAPVPADYDGDGRADLSTRDTWDNWYIDYASNGFGNWDAIYHGFAGVDYAPVPADYDGDGRADLASRDTWNTWFIDYAANGFGVWDVIRGGFGARSTYMPAPADYDGDGKADLASRTDSGDWQIDYASDSFGVWNRTWNSFATISSGSALTSDDILKFESKWMQAGQMASAIGESCYFLSQRADWAAWATGERMEAMVRMYELTRKPIYFNHLRQFVQCALQYRDDHSPGAVDEIRGVAGLPAWGGRSLNTANRDRVDETISSVYAHGIAAYARVVLEDPNLRPMYGAEAIDAANAVLQTVNVFLPQIRFSRRNGFVEAYLALHPNMGTVLSDAVCNAALANELALYPDLDDEEVARMEQQTTNCRNAWRSAGRPMAQNENQAFMMVLIEMARVLDTPAYRASSSSAGAQWARNLFPLLVSRGQRFLMARLQTIGTDPSSMRFRWNHVSDLPSGIAAHYDDASHASVSMRYIGLLNRDLARLNVVAAAQREAIPLTPANLRTFANTFLYMTTRGHIAENVNGTAAEPIDKQNWTCEGWVYLTAGDNRVYDRCHEISLRRVNGAQSYLSPSAHSAILANKAVRYPHANIGTAASTGSATLVIR